MFFVSVLIVCLFRAGFALKLVCHRIYSISTIFLVFLLTNHFVISLAFGEVCGLFAKVLMSGV